ncbi:hypothetical protein KI387_039565, partial [Taxus chinensis]
MSPILKDGLTVDPVLEEVSMADGAQNDSDHTSYVESEFEESWNTDEDYDGGSIGSSAPSNIEIMLNVEELGCLATKDISEDEAIVKKTLCDSNKLKILDFKE